MVGKDHMTSRCIGAFRYVDSLASSMLNEKALHHGFSRSVRSQALASQRSDAANGEAADLPGPMLVFCFAA